MVLNGIKRKDSYYNLKDFTVWCVRIPNSIYYEFNPDKQKRRDRIQHQDRIQDKNIENKYSSPCEICLRRIKEFGFGKIAFSDRDGNITIHKVSEYDTDHQSNVQKKLIEHIRF